MKIIRKLEYQEHEKTRELYELIFKEDTKSFVDYYYQFKAAENQIYIIEEKDSKEIISMLHLNPYSIQLGNTQYNAHYIVAVATREEYRHQGMMRKLLEYALRDMYDNEEPFTFLMPAAEGIYRPFDFRFIYDQNQIELIPGEYQKEPDLEFYCVGAEDMMDLERFASDTLPKQYGVYTRHSEDYFHRQLLEQKCQNGSIVIMLEKGLVKGYFYTAEESEPEIREAVVANGYEAQLFPVIAKCFRGCEKVKVKGFPGILEHESVGLASTIMARIVHLQHFMEGFTAKEPVELQLFISDSLISENTGSYIFTADPKGAKLIDLYQEEYSLSAANLKEEEIRITIAELAELAFGYKTPEQMNMPQSFTEEWKKLNLFMPVFLNELV